MNLWGEEYNTWLSNLKEGDAFCYKGRHHKSYVFDKVSKITPKRKIRTEKGLTFRSNGTKEVASTWDDSPWMEPITEEKLKFNKRIENLTLIEKCKFEKLDDKIIDEIVNLIK